MKLRELFDSPLSSDDIGDALVILICVASAGVVGLLAWAGII